MIFQVIGWLGAIIFVVSYFLLSDGHLRQEGKTYHILNMIGAVCLVINALYFQDHANLMVNGVWCAIALMAIYKSGVSFFRNRS